MFYSQVWSQSETCVFSAVQQSILLQDVDYQSKIGNYELQYQQNPAQRLAQTDLYEIPTVVHVIHNGGIENISDAQIYQAIEEANLQFDGSEGGYNTKIKLTLAKIDPLGNCTNGINRVLSTITTASHTDAIIDLSIKNLSRWNTKKYLYIKRGKTPKS